MISVSIAFIVFGIIDNGLMIIAGSAIDHFFGSMLSISTMASAGFGNAISDFAGIIMGRYTENTIHRIFPHDNNGLSNVQIIISESVGILLGCLIGMSPLLIF